MIFHVGEIYFFSCDPVVCLPKERRMRKLQKDTQCFIGYRTFSTTVVRIIGLNEIKFKKITDKRIEYGLSCSRSQQPHAW